MEIKKLGIDFVFIDTEHIPLDRAQLSWMCQTYKALDIAPIVRIQSPDPYQACMTIDAGACGIMAPYIETVEQVRTLKGAVKLRPLKGKKLNDVLDGKVKLSRDEEEYFIKFNQNNLLFLNIESKPGLDALDDMLQIPQIDGIIIGPHDLSINLGIPGNYNHPVFDQAVRAIIQKAKAHNIGVGNHYSCGIEQEIDWAKHGMNIILHSADITGFLKYIGSDIKAIKKALGDKTEINIDNVDI